MIETILEILKYILPALIVFLTVYFIMKKYLDQQYGLEVLKYKQQQGKDILPLKLQAYERLAVFCERISIDNLSYRLSGADMDHKALANAMLIAIQQEYEHNLSQQVYVSNKLWEIITIAKNQVQNIVSTAASHHGVTSPAQLIDRAMEILVESGGNPLDTAKRAIKKEVDIIL